jgi:hypothetical protein
MNGYLGEFPVDVTTHPTFSKYTPADWAMLFIGKYSGIDGDHHKTWVFDQVARILKGTPVVVVEARWDKPSSEYRFTVADPPSEAYTEWVKQMTSGVNEGYDWDTGITP